VLGENVLDTQRLAMSGNADVAIIALSLALASDGKWTRLPERLHEPLEQALVVTGEAENAARARRFADFLGGEEGRAIMRRYGFLLPGERLESRAGAGG
jgi:molybdate transport system substrate-binding protein